MKYQSNYKPWKENLQWALMSLVIIGAAYFALFRNNKINEFLLIAGIAFVSAIYNINNLFIRIHGQTVEKRSLKDLKKVAGDRLTQNVMIPGYGDADGILKFDSQTFNIEIKSIQNPKKVTAAHIIQVKAQAAYLKTTPVVWLPKSPTMVAAEKDGVKIYGCSAKELFKYLK